ncbi:class I SAM-dependent methyltransferase [Olivibacter sp. CPCC 100613]|uniref:class I SAM-dependent methyltransferase n=1 Tax=Olivibacter sp. CPCC 100613 TaxID=3079931 RepID=UPI002FFA9897
MKENKYDDLNFFVNYSAMPRSVVGLEAAGEWPTFRALLPNLANKSILDLGCGYGWHCRYAMEQKAKQVIGIDLSKKMLEKAKALTEHSGIRYECRAIEDVVYDEATFDVVISSLALHYVQDFQQVCQRVYHCLVPGGVFVFSVEHPIFTAMASQDWFYDEQGHRSHWPVDHYFSEGLRKTQFLQEEVVKYHRTVESYLSNLLDAGFAINRLCEPKPSAQALKDYPDMVHELRRPIFLLLSVSK